MKLHHRFRQVVVPATAVLVAALLLIPGASVGAPATSWDARECGQVGGALVFAQAQETVGLDPADVSDGFSVNVTSNMFDTLVRFKANGTEVEPSLAESWSVSPDGLNWTFRLRRDVMFHDGTPFNADAVVFSTERQMDAKHPYHHGQFEYAGFTYQNVKSVTKVDTYSVRFTLSAPFAPFLSNMAMFSTSISSPTAIKKYGKDYFKNPVGTGPFRFVEWVQKDHVTLQANQDYWAGRPCVDRLVIRGIPDNTVRLLEMERGRVHVMDQINPPDYDRIRKNSNLVLFTGPGLNVGYLALNVQKDPFKDVRVRRAVNHAVNKDALARAFYGGIARPATNPMPPTVWGFNDGVKGYAFDLERAKQLLAEAGYPNGISTELWWPNRARPYLTQPQKVAEALQQQLARANIRAKLVTFEWGTYLDKTDSGEHPMAILGWIGDNGDPDNFLYVLLDADNAKPGTATNISFYGNSRVHDLLIKAQQTAGQAERARLYRQAQEIIFQDAPWVPLVYGARVAAYRKQVQNYFPHPLEIRWLHRVWLSQ